MPPLYLRSEVRSHTLESSRIGERFTVRVALPIRSAETHERFPVVYATDADEFFPGLLNIAQELQLVGEAPRFILVGIGYENPHDADLLRMRDLFPHSVRKHFLQVIEQLAEAPLGYSLLDVKTLTETTDAQDFLEFLRETVIPFVNDAYPTLPDDRSYFGYSAGGTFGLYTLFHAPQAFGRYILGSPATSYDGVHFGIEMAQAALTAGTSPHARVFLSAGELEEFYGKFDLVTGYYRMAKFLQAAHSPRLDLELRLFPQETHATSWTLAFTHGIKALFKTDNPTPWWPTFD